MKAEVLSESEGMPENWPDAPESLSEAAADILAGAVWRRIESFIVYRWAVRSIVWKLRGPGLWVPRIGPAEIDEIDKWNYDSERWESSASANGPEGFIFSGGTYRVKCDVGDDSEPPDAVMVAYSRLAEYWAEVSKDAGITQIADGDFSMRRSANAMGRALFYSGAADLLRPWKDIF